MQRTIHELTNLEKKLDRLENHYVQVKEFKEKIIFLRSIAKGLVIEVMEYMLPKWLDYQNQLSIDRANQIMGVLNYEKIA